MLTSEQLLALSLLPGIGKITIQKLGYYVSANINTEIYDLYELLAESISKKVISRIKIEHYTQDNVKDAIETARRKIETSDKLGIRTIGLFDELYPRKLKEFLHKGKNDSPIIIYTKGNISCLNEKGIAIIGTREPTISGETAGTYFSAKFADLGFNIISGLAKGCDTIAHKGALSVNGFTTAFLASGLDQPIYPKENSGLANEILEKNGLIISEYPIGTELKPHFLVERDRLQSGLADATLVIQTGEKGGTMHAVQTTLDSSKPLFTVEYKSGNEHAKIQGNIKLIKEGKASPLRSDNFNSVMDEINKSIKRKQYNLQNLF